MSKRASLFIASFLCFAAGAVAGPIIYDVTVDTSSIFGTPGSLDFNFKPGPLVTQAASLQIFGFASDGTLAGGSCLTGGPCLTGDASGGPLPATLTFHNGTGFNDYFGDFTFGSTISFQVSLYGPALSSPDGVSTSGSKFAFSMFSDAAGTIPALTTDTTDGFAFTVDVNLDGTTTVTNFSSRALGHTEVRVAAPGHRGQIRIGRLQAAHLRFAHPFHQAVLRRLKKPFDPPFGLGRQRRYPPDSQFP